MQMSIFVHLIILIKIFFGKEYILLVTMHTLILHGRIEPFAGKIPALFVFDFPEDVQLMSIQ